MQIFKENVPSEKLVNVLELSKRQSAEIVVIPQILGYHSMGDWHIGGTTSNSIITTTKLETLEGEHVVVWQTCEMPYIAFYYKDLNFFLKLIRENELDSINVYMKRFVINGIVCCLGIKMSADVQVEWKDPRNQEVHMVNPTLKLLPYQQPVDMMKDVLSKWETARKYVLSMPVHTDPKIKQIWGCKASEGAKLWVPSECNTLNKEELRPYVLYLNKSMFSFGKQDKVELQIKDAIQGESPNIFMYSFNVLRRLKGINTNNRYYMMGLKV